MKFEDRNQFLMHEDEQVLIRQANNYRQEVPNKETIEYLAERVPPGSVYEKLVYFLKRRQITFSVADSESETHFLRNSTGKYDIPYFDTCVVVKGSLPVFKIHVTKARFDTELKDNIEAQAMLLQEFYAETFLVSSIKGTRRQFALEKAKALCDPSRRGLYLDRRRQRLLDNAVKKKNLKYLLGIIDKYDIRKDPDRVYLQATYQAIGKFKTINISTGRQLLAWYRYMLESRRKSENWKSGGVVLKISKIIKESVKKDGTMLGTTGIKTEKSLIYKSDITTQQAEFSKYNQSFVFPYYLKGKIIFMPQCHIELSEKIFVRERLDTVNDEDSLVSFAKDIEQLASKKNSLAEIETGLKDLDGVMVVRRILQSAQNIIKERMAQDDKRAVVIGVLAPASAGKTTLSTMLTLGSRVKGLKACYWGCDSDGFLHPGPRFRYDIKGKTRTTHIWGPGIYDAVKIRRKLDHLKQGGALTKPADQYAIEPEEIGPGENIIVSDGVFIGVDNELLDIIDILVCLSCDNETETTRLDLKWIRDTNTRTKHGGIDLMLDFAEKQFYETRDGMRTLVPERADFVWVRKQHELYVRQGSFEERRHHTCVLNLFKRKRLWG